jgi:hypothetical protein
VIIGIVVTAGDRPADSSLGARARGGLRRLVCRRRASRAIAQASSYVAGSVHPQVVGQCLVALAQLAGGGDRVGEEHGEMTSSFFLSIFGSVPILYKSPPNYASERPMSNLPPADESIDLWLWTYTDDAGKRRQSRYRMTEADARARLRDPQRVDGSLERRTLHGPTSGFQSRP